MSLAGLSLRLRIFLFFAALAIATAIMTGPIGSEPVKKRRPTSNRSKPANTIRSIPDSRATRTFAAKPRPTTKRLMA